MQNVKELMKADHTAVQRCRPGAEKENQGIRFSLAVPMGKKAELFLYHKTEKEKVCRFVFREGSGPGAMQSMKIIGLNWKTWRYRFEIDGKTVSDPYARGILGDQCEMSFPEPSGREPVRPMISWEDGILYHLHVRNFTMQRNSRVRHKGTFQGLQEKIPYLLELGVNQVLLMPVYDFTEEPGEQTVGISGTAPRNNYWGYQKGAYFAPKRGYAATADPVREFRTMVQKFHESGMEILLEFYFDWTVPLGEQLDCLRYWAETFRVDGFRILGETGVIACAAADPCLADVKLLAFEGGQTVSAIRDSYGRMGAEMNDAFLQDMRRFLKGDEGMLEAVVYKMKRNPERFGIINYMTSHDGFTLQDLVSYDHKHNEDNGEQNRDGSPCNYSWNCGVEGPTRKKDVLRLRERMKRNAILLMLLSAGTPMLLAGDEFGNSQQGNNNPYCQDNEISWTDWSALRKNRNFFRFVQTAIAFRKSQKLLHRREECRNLDYNACGYPDLSYHGKRAWYGDFDYPNRQIGMLYCGSYVGEEQFLYLLYNMHPQEQELALPRLPEGMEWDLLADTMEEENFCEKPVILEEKQKTLRVPPRTIQILRARPKRVEERK